MALKEKILFITGRLAERSLKRVLDEMGKIPFEYEIRNLNINVASLLTTQMIERRIGDISSFDRVIIPGKARGDLSELSKKLNVDFFRGPDELKDLPNLFGKESLKHDLSQYEVSIFAEITDAPNMSLEEIVKQANFYRDNGADVIDIGCLPNIKFNHLEEVVKELKHLDFYVSIDSHDDKELIRGGKAGADYLLSIKSDNFHILDEVDSYPILIPLDGKLDELYKVIDKCIEQKRTFIADSILDPINYGFTESIVRYAKLRKKYPDIDMMMGTGNLTELSHADTTGITLMLMGIISELKIHHILTTQVSDHCKTVIKETDIARRILYASRVSNTTPKHISNNLLTTHEDKPFKFSYDEVLELSKDIKDPSYRIMVTDKGIHVFNRDGFKTAYDPYDFFKNLDVGDDSGHAFYLGVELARAQIAHQLGKFYSQDEELSWGCLVEKDEDDKMSFKPTGPTYKKK
ncbi:MAG: dihydropteroate synthase [Gammaproteobacteria bacterium]|nr:dihydropteroate synthase [Gammaproteobacteria bacterium]